MTTATEKPKAIREKVSKLRLIEQTQPLQTHIDGHKLTEVAARLDISAEKPKAIREKVSKLRLIEQTQPRKNIDLDIVSEYADWLKAHPRREMPPVTVFQVADLGLVVADGFHRKLAYDSVRQEIPAILLPGGLLEAMLYSCKANATHGLRRTAADKRRSVEKLLAHEETCDWTDRRIADACAVSNSFVGSVRVSVHGEHMHPQRKYERGGAEHIQNVKLNPGRNPNEQDRALRRIVSAIELLAKQSVDQFDRDLTEPLRERIHRDQTLVRARAFLDAL